MTLSPRDHEEGNKSHSVTAELALALSRALSKSTISHPSPNFSTVCYSKQFLGPVRSQGSGPGGNEQRASSSDSTRVM